jgi:hypothetical protein
MPDERKAQMGKSIPLLLLKIDEPSVGNGKRGDSHEIITHQNRKTLWTIRL